MGYIETLYHKNAIELENHKSKTIKLNNKFIFTDIKSDRISFDAWRRYTIKAREMDWLLFPFLFYTIIFVKK